MKMRECAWCNLTEEEKRWQLRDMKYWTIYLADEQEYIGKCILVLKRHCGSLPGLRATEWDELRKAINELECCLKVALGAELCNWSCLMNSFYKNETPNPHLHITVRPRYKKPVILNGKKYVDMEYGHHYKVSKAVYLDEKEMRTIFNLLKESLEHASS